jgi:hypothetical protein
VNESPYKWYDVSSSGALARTARLGSRWFYWIAVLSLINTLLFCGGAPIRIALGLGFTQLIDVVVRSVLPEPPYLSLAVDVIIAAAFISFGYLSGHGEIWAFVTGLVLYLCDALLYVVLMFLGKSPVTIVAIIWHGIACYFLWKGLQAARELAALPSHQEMGSV